MDLPTPDALQVTLTLLSLILAFFAVVKVFIPICRWFARGISRVSGALDNLGGRAGFIDPATGKQVAAIPPIGERLTGIDSRLDALLDVNSRIDHLDQRQTITEAEVKLLKEATTERIVTKAESAQMWRAVANADTINGEVDDV